MSDPVANSDPNLSAETIGIDKKDSFGSSEINISVNGSSHSSDLRIKSPSLETINLNAPSETNALAEPETSTPHPQSPPQEQDMNAVSETPEDLPTPTAVDEANDNSRDGSSPDIYDGAYTSNASTSSIQTQQFPSITSPIRSPRNSIHRRRAPSLALSTGSVDGTETKSAMLFIKNALDTIKASKDAKRIPALAQALNKVLVQFEETPEAMPAPSLIMEALQLVCAQGVSTEMRVVALDCIGKLFTFAYLEDEDTDENAVPMINLAIAIVCDTFEHENTDPRIELQIVKALGAAIVNEDLIAHGRPLLDAIRQVYNIFVVSKSASNQNIAQVTLTQMINAVFDRAAALAINQSFSHSRNASESFTSLPSDRLTLENMKKTTEEDPTGSAENDLIVKDAFFVFRTLCKLSEKTDVNINNLKSHGMRSKLLSLHLLHSTLKHSISVFSAKNLFVKFTSKQVRFVDAIKDYLCSSISQNALSISPPIFEISVEIFWILLSNLRSEFKRELQVFFIEIYLHILDLKSATSHQKIVFFNVIQRLCNDPRALVELYLNYDCDTTMPNIFEKIIDVLVRIATTKVTMTSQSLNYYRMDKNKHSIAIYHLNQPPSLAITNLVARGTKIDTGYYPREYSMKIMSLECLVAVLRSLLLWSNRGGDEGKTVSNIESENQSRENLDSSENLPDDPSRFESNKKSKREINEAVKEFNYKPSRGIKKFLDAGIMKSEEPSEISRVLISTPGINLAVLGDFLGKGENNEVLHHFVAQVDMKGLGFVAALRLLLQKFRLPGEGQVVDRCVLEFASQYVQDNPTVFSDAKFPYMLAYSVMLLNTDLHNNQVKRKKMSVEDFILNNRFINEPVGLPEEFQKQVYEEIANNEIKLDSEQEYHAIKGDTIVGSTEEAYMAASEAIMSRTTKLFKSMGSRKSSSSNQVYYNASHTEHIHPMFDLVWMSILAGFSGPFQQTDTEEITDLCVEGLMLATRICCHYDIELGRISFVQTLTKFTNFSDYSSIGLKNIAIIRAVLKIALHEGDYLKSSWYDIIMIISHISQLERAQSADAMPNFSSLKTENPSSSGFLSPEIAKLICSREHIINCDKVFTQSSNLSLAGILDFVKALCSVSLEEIENSRQSVDPRLFCLQKIVDVCYYNMHRIKVEWSQIWAVMNDQFNKVCVNQNVSVHMFALDSLRQLSLRFLEMEELSHFQFQKDFLKPFEFTMIYNSADSAKLHSIECLRQLILSKHQNMKSGWIAVFNTLEAAAEQSPAVLAAAFELVNEISNSYLDEFISHEEALHHYLSATSAMAKQSDSKIALHCADLLNQLLKKSNDPKMWDLITSEFHAIILRGVDPEVRSKSLGYLFDVLMEEGSAYTKQQWDQICKEKLFPLFYVLEKNPVDQAVSDEESIWISTTLWQALQKIMDLFAKYFDALSDSLDTFFLDLLKTCICQENDDVSRMGFRCLVTLIKDNATKFTDTHWGQIGHKIDRLFQDTTPKELGESAFRQIEKANTAEGASQSLQGAIPKSIHQLRLIDTTDELLDEKIVFNTMPVQDILKIIECLRGSYDFARAFNQNHSLRVEICQKGYMKHVPNLSKIERTAVHVYVKQSMILYRSVDRFESENENREELRQQLFPVCTTVLNDYNSLNSKDERHVNDLMPIVVDILKELTTLPSKDFRANVSGLYMETIQLLNKDMSSDLRETIQSVLLRVAQVHMLGEDENKNSS